MCTVFPASLFSAPASKIPLLAGLSIEVADRFPPLDFKRGRWPFTSLYRRRRKPVIIAIQYTLYEITEPYVAEFCHPRMALKIPHPPPPLSSGFPN